MAIPIRRCLTCRRAASKRALVRLVVADGQVVADPEAHSPGRGAYLCGAEVCLDTALRRDAASIFRALRVKPTQVTVDREALRAGWREARARHEDEAREAAASRPGRDA